MDIIIRNEVPADYRAVENLTRESFWNVYKSGADEHYYVHKMRSHHDFLPELAFVLEKDGEIIGNIMYTKPGWKTRTEHARRSCPLALSALHRHINGKNTANCSLNIPLRLPERWAMM